MKKKLVAVTAIVVLMAAIALPTAFAGGSNSDHNPPCGNPAKDTPNGSSAKDHISDNGKMNWFGNASGKCPTPTPTPIPIPIPIPIP